MQGNVFWERVTLPVGYVVDGVDASVSPRKHANVLSKVLTNWFTTIHFFYSK
jgi:hypothetical protein